MRDRLPSSDHERALSVSHWSTQDIAPDRRLAVWLARPIPSLARLFDVCALSPFNTAVEEVHLGETMLQFAEGTARSYERTASRIAEDAVDLIGVSMLQTGAVDGRTDHGDFHAAPGDIILLDLTQRTSLTFTASASIQWAIPRRLAEQYFGSVAALHGTVIQSATAAAILGYVTALRGSLPTFSRGQGLRIARNLLDLLAIILKREGVSAPEPTEISCARMAAEQAVERQLQNKSLNAETLCTQLGISRAHLFRLFKADGGFLAYTRGRRLERVRQSLDDRNQSASLAVLAELWGFSDAPHLSRLFRERFGVTPSVYRKKTS